MDNMDDILRAIIMAKLDDWAGNAIGPDEIDDYVVSTCETAVFGWETAITKAPLDHWVVVARYANKEEAQAGHNTWCSFLKLNKPTHAYSVETEKIEVL